MKTLVEDQKQSETLIAERESSVAVVEWTSLCGNKLSSVEGFANEASPNERFRVAANLDREHLIVLCAGRYYLGFEFQRESCTFAISREGIGELSYADVTADGRILASSTGLSYIVPRHGMSVAEYLQRLRTKTRSLKLEDGRPLVIVPMRPEVSVEVFGSLASLSLKVFVNYHDRRFALGEKHFPGSVWFVDKGKRMRNVRSLEMEWMIVKRLHEWGCESLKPGEAGVFYVTSTERVRGFLDVGLKGLKKLGCEVMFSEALEARLRKFFPQCLEEHEDVDAQTAMTNHAESWILEGFELPKLGAPQVVGELAWLSVDDAKLFAQAMTHYSNRHWRSAIDCFRKIEAQDDPIVRYFLERLVYEFEGGISQDELAAAMMAARDAGLADAMYAYVVFESGRREGKGSNNEDLILWVRRAIAAGCADAYCYLASMFEEGSGSFPQRRDLARRLYRQAADAGSFEGLLNVIMDFAFARNGGQSMLAISSVVRRMLGMMGDDLGELSKIDLLSMGIVYAKGIAVTKNRKRARECLERVIASKGVYLGNDRLAVAMAWIYLGNLCQEDCVDGIAEENGEAIRCYEQALAICPSEGVAEYRLGVCYSRDDLGVRNDMHRMMEYYRRSAAKGCAAAMFQLAMSLFVDGPEQDIPNARISLEEAAALDWPEALHQLGYMKCCGRHYDQDLEGGLRLIEKAVAQGDCNAMNTMGVLYRDGVEGLEPDQKKARQWFERSAEMKCQWGMINLADLYESGAGIEQDVYRSRQLLEQAFAHKSDLNASSCAANNLGVNYARGVYGPIDWREACEWWQKASDLGNVSGLCQLGEAYRKGCGVEKDIHKAEKYLLLAGDRGDKIAARILGDLYADTESPLFDLDKSEAWYRKSFQHGNQLAMVAIGRLLWGRNKKVEARRWFEDSWSKGRAEGAYYLAVVNLVDVPNHVADQQPDYSDWALALSRHRDAQMRIADAMSWLSCCAEKCEKNDEILPLVRLWQARCERFCGKVQEAEAFYLDAERLGLDNAVEELDGMMAGSGQCNRQQKEKDNRNGLHEGCETVARADDSCGSNVGSSKRKRDSGGESSLKEGIVEGTANIYLKRNMTSGKLQIIRVNANFSGQKTEWREYKITRSETWRLVDRLLQRLCHDQSLWWIDYENHFTKLFQAPDAKRFKKDCLGYDRKEDSKAYDKVAFKKSVVVCSCKK